MELCPLQVRRDERLNKVENTKISFVHLKVIFCYSKFVVVITIFFNYFFSVARRQVRTDRSFDIFWILKRFCAHHHVHLLYDGRHWTRDAEISLVEEVFDDNSNNSIYCDHSPRSSIACSQSLQLSNFFLVSCATYGLYVSCSVCKFLQEIIHQEKATKKKVINFGKGI
jgi:hypothetical protein